MVQYNGPERLRMQLQEQWIRAIVREELVQMLADLAGASRSGPALPDARGVPMHTNLVSAACEAVIVKIKERTEHDRGHSGR